MKCQPIYDTHCIRPGYFICRFTMFCTGKKMDKITKVQNKNYKAASICEQLQTLQHFPLPCYTQCDDHTGKCVAS